MMGPVLLRLAWYQHVVWATTLGAGWPLVHLPRDAKLSDSPLVSRIADRAGAGHVVAAHRAHEQSDLVFSPRRVTKTDFCLPTV